MKIADDQLEFASLAWPKDRKVLRVAEVAERWSVSEKHMINLLEEGKMDGFDIAAGRQDYVRVSLAAITELARVLKIDESIIWHIIRDVKPVRKTARRHWRVPVEGYLGFITENHSRAK